MKQVADVRGGARQHLGNRHVARRRRRPQRAHRGEMGSEGPRLQATEFVLAHRVRQGVEQQPGDSLAEVADIEHGDASGGLHRQGMDGPARHAADPARTEAAVTVQQ